MSVPTTIPITISPEAADRVAELGMQKELDIMIEHVRQTAPGLQRIEVTQAERYDLGGEPGVTIEAFSDRPFVPEERTDWDWSRWMIETFPSHVLEHFAMMFRYGPDHAG
jgi:hypothetical protein